jgi:hypothetical protein
MNTSTRMWSAALLAISMSLGVLGVRNEGVAQARQAVTTVPDVFKPFYQGYILDDHIAAVRAALPLERVSLERRGGMFTPCGCFKLSVARSGDATLWSDEGKTFGGSGDFVGTVNIFDFGKLSHLISQAGIETLNREYTTHMTDVATLTVAIETAHETITITDLGGAGPVQLWSIEQAMTAIGHTIDWKHK